MDASGGNLDDRVAWMERSGAMRQEIPKEELAVYARGALPPEEAAAAVAHLAGWPACRERAHRYREAAAALAYAAPLRRPPLRLKARPLARARGAGRRRERGLAPGIAPIAAVLTPTPFAPSLGFRFGAPPRVVPLQGAEGHLILKDRQAPPVTKGLAVPPEGQVDPVGFADAAERRVSGGILCAQARPYGVYMVNVPLPLTAHVCVGATLEPEGGSLFPARPQALRSVLR